MIRLKQPTAMSALKKSWIIGWPDKHGWRKGFAESHFGPPSYAKCLEKIFYRFPNMV